MKINKLTGAKQVPLPKYWSILKNRGLTTFDLKTIENSMAAETKCIHHNISCGWRRATVPCSNL